MINIISRFKWLIIFSIILIGFLSFFYYRQQNKKIKENTIKAEVELNESGFIKLYQKEDNVLCVNTKDEQKQDDISKDMLWTLELDKKNYQKIEKVNCKNGNQGIEIK